MMMIVAYLICRLYLLLTVIMQSITLLLNRIIYFLLSLLLLMHTVIEILWSLAILLYTQKSQHLPLIKTQSLYSFIIGSLHVFKFFFFFLIIINLFFLINPILRQNFFVGIRPKRTCQVRKFGKPFQKVNFGVISNKKKMYLNSY